MFKSIIILKLWYQVPDSQEFLIYGTYKYLRFKMFKETILSYSNFDDILVRYKYSVKICVQLALVLLYSLLEYIFVNFLHTVGEQSNQELYCCNEMSF